MRQDLYFRDAKGALKELRQLRYLKILTCWDCFHSSASRGHLRNSGGQERSEHLLGCLLTSNMRPGEKGETHCKNLPIITGDTACHLSDQYDLLWKTSSAFLQKPLAQQIAGDAYFTTQYIADENTFIHRSKKNTVWLLQAAFTADNRTAYFIGT